MQVERLGALADLAQQQAARPRPSPSRGPTSCGGGGASLGLLRWRMLGGMEQSCSRDRQGGSTQPATRPRSAIQGLLSALLTFACAALAAADAQMLSWSGISAQPTYTQASFERAEAPSPPKCAPVAPMTWYAAHLHRWPRAPCICGAPCRARSVHVNQWSPSSPYSPKWRGDVAICAIMRQEDPRDIEEFIKYHRCAPSPLLPCARPTISRVRTTLLIPAPPPPARQRDRISS